MDELKRKVAKEEIDESLKFVLFSMRPIGLTLHKAHSFTARICQKFLFFVAICGISFHVFSELAYIVLTFARSPRVEHVVPLFHTFGYGLLSIAKILVLSFKNTLFSELVEELAGIWPMPPMNNDAKNNKDHSLKTLNISHQWYFWLSVIGVWFFNLTPICTYFYHVWQGVEAHVGFIWSSWYPFDKHQPVAHVFAYIFEMYVGVACVVIMMSSDLLFSGMASHIAMLLDILKGRIESFASVPKTDEDNYEDLRSNIKLHQRLISYCNSLEDAFSLVNLINIVMSSIIICCVVFVIVLLEPLMAISNKFFLASILLQIGAMCWYADAILHANGNIANAAYNSNWYKTSPRCRRALLFLIVRSQKPIAFTAMKFTNISLQTYSSILTRSYSYFTLLYTMYRDN